MTCLDQEDAAEERAAVVLLRSGSVAGLERLVRMHQATGLLLAGAIVHDRALAEDVVAEAFLTAYERIAGFDAGRPFRPWFLKIVVNSALGHARRAAVRERFLRRSAWSDALQSQDPAEIAEDRETAARLLEAMRRLTPALRTVLVLRYFLDMGQAEMATVLGCPEGTVKRRLHDARRRLRRLFDDHPEGASQSVQEVMP